MSGPCPKQQHSLFYSSFLNDQILKVRKNLTPILPLLRIGWVPVCQIRRQEHGAPEELSFPAKFSDLCTFDNLILFNYVTIYPLITWLILTNNIVNSAEIIHYAFSCFHPQNYRSKNNVVNSQRGILNSWLNYQNEVFMHSKNIQNAKFLISYFCLHFYVYRSNSNLGTKKERKGKGKKGKEIATLVAK